MPRPISKFALTIPRYSDKDVLSVILSNEFNAKAFAISKEEHHQNALPSQEKWHLHAYFELDPNTCSTEINSVRERLHSAFQAVTGEAGPGFDIQSAKRPEKWLKYITKVSTLNRFRETNHPPWGCAPNPRLTLRPWGLRPQTPRVVWNSYDLIGALHGTLVANSVFCAYRKILTQLLSESILAPSTCASKSSACPNSHPLTQLTPSLSPILINGDLLNECGMTFGDENQKPSPDNNCHPFGWDVCGINSSSSGSADGTTMKETPVGALRNHTQPWSVRRTQVKRLLQEIYALI